MTIRGYSKGHCVEINVNAYPVRDYRVELCEKFKSEHGLDVKPREVGMHMG